MLFESDLDTICRGHRNLRKMLQQWPAQIWEDRVLRVYCPTQQDASDLMDGVTIMLPGLKDLGVKECMYFWDEPLSERPFRFKVDAMIRYESMLNQRISEFW